MTSESALLPTRGERAWQLRRLTRLTHMAVSARQRSGSLFRSWFLLLANWRNRLLVSALNSFRRAIESTGETPVGTEKHSRPPSTEGSPWLFTQAARARYTNRYANYKALASSRTLALGHNSARHLCSLEHPQRERDCHRCTLSTVLQFEFKMCMLASASCCPAPPRSRYLLPNSQDMGCSCLVLCRC